MIGKTVLVACISAVLAASAAVALLSCSSGGDAGGTAKELADKLTSSMEFNDGKLAEGGPPPYHGSADYPQITLVDPPQVEIAFGSSFTLKVKTDFPSPGEITGAMIWVKDSGMHIDVNRAVDADTLIMTLEARLKNDPALAGKTFDAYVSLYKGNETGLHQTWRITVP